MIYYLRHTTFVVIEDLKFVLNIQEKNGNGEIHLLNLFAC